MSNTSTTHPRPLLCPVTNPEELTGARAKIYRALTHHPGSSAATLALAAGVGHSTAGKALSALESLGLALRETGDSTPRQATPDLWHPQPDTTPATVHPTSDRKHASEEHTEIGETNAPDPEPEDAYAPAGTATNESPDGETAAAQEQPETATASAGPHRDNETGTTREEEAVAEPGAPDEYTDDPGASAPAPDSPDAPAPETTNGEERPAAAPASSGTCREDEGTEAHPPQEPEVHRPVTTVPVPASTGAGRLRPGALREMVAAHLATHPEEAFTATGISRTIGKSSGAIANSLVTLTKQGSARQVCEAPRRYQHAVPGHAGETTKVEPRDG